EGTTGAIAACSSDALQNDRGRVGAFRGHRAAVHEADLTPAARIRWVAPTVERAATVATQGTGGYCGNERPTHADARVLLNRHGNAAAGAAPVDVDPVLVRAVVTKVAGIADACGPALRYHRHRR